MIGGSGSARRDLQDQIMRSHSFFIGMNILTAGRPLSLIAIYHQWHDSCLPQNVRHLTFDSGQTNRNINRFFVRACATFRFH